MNKRYNETEHKLQIGYRHRLIFKMKLILIMRPTILWSLKTKPDNFQPNYSCYIFL